jgi:LysM repeat protein
MRINNITNSNQKFNEGDKVYLSENVSELSAVEKQNQDIIAAVVYKPLNDSTLIPASYFKGNGKEITLVKSNPAEKSFLKLIEYQVQKKETLLDIGNRYGILITKIMELNRMQTVKLKPGQRIFIDTEWINPQRAKANTPTSPTADL